MNALASIPDRHFRLLFHQSPAVLLVLRPDCEFTIVDATEERLWVTMTRREDIVGRGLFEMFPDNPEDWELPLWPSVLRLRMRLGR